MANTRNRIMVSSNVPIHSELHSLHFRVMTSNDVLQLSVQKIHTHFTFDALDHPYSGGLYDTALGPFSEKSGLCGTCFKNIYQCPGHLGHIELPLSFPENMKSMISLVLDLLDSGFICEAQELFQQMGIMDDEQKINLEDDLEDNLLNERYGKYFGLLLNNSGHCGDNEDNFLNKNIESLKIFFVFTIFKLYSKVREVCINCKEKQAKIKMHQGKIMIVEPDKKQEQDGTLCTNEPKILMPDQLKDIMRSLWKNEKNVLRKIYYILATVEIDYPTDIFFLDVIPVTPSSVRPINIVESKMVEHPQTILYKNILQNCNFLSTIIHVEQSENIKNVSENMRALYDELEGTSAAEKINIIWQDLQYSINNLMTSEAKQEYNAIGQGIKEVIEKKHGIIRKHMMGKRVNFAARSVITPDPNLNIDEIGVPEEFAKRLTYPVPVTSWNVREMEKLILNGPLIHPGAVMIEFEDGSVKNIPANIKVQEVIAKKLLLSEESESKENFNGLKIVHRHLLNGDPLIMNRQPTLHKPSIMAHKAKVLKGEKTLRLHYANCKAYNADFDGDEMNAHFPQNELARSEAHSIANVSNQYLVPKDGTPLSGLIQDNVISGVSLSLRGTFFSKPDYQSLVYFALGHKTGHIQTLQPAVLKPVPLWSGKQIISTVIINNLPKNSSLINLDTKAKIGAKVWENSKKHTWRAGGAPFTKEHTMCESEVIIRNGELLCGVLDKTQYGATPYGLVHCVYELYGGSYSINLLSSFSKLFTFFLQREGFTLGVQDILVTAEANKKRKEFITESRKVGPALLASIVNISSDNSEDLVTSKIEEMCAINSKFKTIIDRRYKTTMDSFSNDINKTCVPSGLIKQFPENNLQLMIQSGAKGSAVNAMQISSLLGQIELEGKRPPCMLSGRSLPSFRPFDSSPRAGGFIDGRFMSGIRPQEFFFHCMAGREGLIDTAVKTSRSGYLQRCLVKHLEGLNVAYDLTVRDSDNSVIQFLYGEDGMDVSKVQFMNSKHISFLADNINAIITKDLNKYFEESNKKLEKHRKSVRKWIKKYGNPISNKSNKYTEEYFGRKTCPDPVISKFQPDSHFGVLNERLQLLMNDRVHNRENPENFIKMMEFKSSSSMCSPGEPVGLLAAQSIGEPSTQMTLNTFHFAGRGDMNVTLGIPRLKEMLMTASKYIKTPNMAVPFLENLNNLEKVADCLRRRLTRVTVDQVLEKVNIKIKLDFKVGREQIYTVRFHFLPYKYYKADFNVKPITILKYMEKHFFIDLFQLLKKQAETKTSVIIIENSKKNKNAYGNAEDEENKFESDEKKIKTQSNFKRYKDESDVESVIDNEEEANNNISDDESDNENEKEVSDIDLNDQVTEENTNTEERNNALLFEEKDVLNKLKCALNYTYDKENSQWCELVFSLPLVFKQIDISALIKEVASKSVIWEVPNIKRAITYRNSKGELMLRTDGLNFIEMFKYRRILDLNRLYSNDIHGVASTYGIEAAVQVMVKEMKDVFSVYGIVVDPRHLVLVADYMMYNGTYQPLSRKGIESGVSPLQQMSFEGSLSFLKSALIGGKTDKLKSPSSCLVTGRPCKGGTGAFSLFHNFQHVS